MKANELTVKNALAGMWTPLCDRTIKDLMDSLMAVTLSVVRFGTLTRGRKRERVFGSLMRYFFLVTYGEAEL